MHDVIPFLILHTPISFYAEIFKLIFIYLRQIIFLIQLFLSMKKLSLVLLLINVGFAHADWTPIAASFNDPKLYIDPDSIKTTIPGRPQVYHIADYAQVQDKDGKDFLSEMFRYEYDCEKSLFREMGHTWHKGGMASDKMVFFSEGAWVWTQPETGSKEEVLLKASCK